MCAEAAIYADHGGVNTEEDFLEKDLSTVLEPHVWSLVQQARPWWRKTLMVGEIDAAARVCLLLVYRVDILRASDADTNAAVSVPRPAHTHIAACSTPYHGLQQPASGFALKRLKTAAALKNLIRATPCSAVFAL